MGIDVDKLISFIEKTQPKQWERYLTIHQGDAKRKLTKRFDEEVIAHGMLHVLRNGIRDRGVTLKVAFFRPVSGLNEELQEKYEANQFNCIGIEEPVHGTVSRKCFSSVPTGSEA